MKHTLDSGSESHHDQEIVPTPKGELSTSSGTVEFLPAERSRDGSPSASTGEQSDAGADDKTVISQRPVAAPEDFYRSMPLSELASILEGRQLDHFAVEQMIGGGGMGAVFRGRDLRLDRIVAIKVIPGSRRDAETLRRFRLEAQAAAKLDHPNIARVYYVGEAEQWNYIVFEFIDGVNIRDLVEMEGPLSVDDAVYYTRQVAEALQHAHERDVVHRDIKPSNVLVTANGMAKVVDMGLARNTSLDKSTADATASGVTLGTFDYISPEQARNPRDADVRSDLYSLGCTLFYMLTGHPPFPEGTALQKLLSHGSQPPPDPRGWRDDLSDQLYEITMKLMAKRPSDRYQKPDELISDLVILAEVEDLPRSQSPGTMLITPSVAQRSLIEANLPWMVALAFLLGSTLWLQSVQSLSSDFTLPALVYESQAELVGAPKLRPKVEPKTVGAPGIDLPEASQIEPYEKAPKSNDSLKPELPTFQSGRLPQTDTGSARGRLEAVSTADLQAMDTLIVSAEKPVDVASSQWASSLTAALKRAAVENNWNVIEIRGRHRLDEPLVFRDRDLQIRGGAGAAIEFTERVVAELPSGEGLFDFQNAVLTFSSLAFDIAMPTDLPAANLGLFRVGGNTEIELNACTVSVRDFSVSPGFHVFLCNSWPLEGATANFANPLGPPDLSPPGTRSQDSRPQDSRPQDSRPQDARPQDSLANSAMVIRVSASVVRGEASFIGVEIPEEALSDRLDVSLSETLVALSGSVLVAKSPTGDAKALRFIRLLCDQSTFVTEDSFARLEYVGDRSPLLGLIRTSQSCVYWSSPQVPHVKISGASRQSLLGNFNLLLLRGMNNLYDANIEDVCECFLGSEKIATFGFTEAQISGWLGERGYEGRVRWQNSNVPNFPLHAAQASDFALTDVLFAPGIVPGNLPQPKFD